MIRIYVWAAAAILGGTAVAPTEVAVSDAMRGAAVEGDALYTWGERLRRWELPGLRSTVLARGRFGEGGCLVDFNHDGRTDVVVQDGAGLGALVWFEAPKWTRHVIDREIEMHDCIAAELLGHRGFLMIHRYSQLRFYEPGGVRDIYSIYTPSRQGGLALADVDGDGRTDILCGNYWVQSPASFELPWRLFAINTISEEPESALFRLAWNGALVVSQGEMKRGRLLLFRRPANPREQWPAAVLAEDLAYPHALLLRDGEIFVGENNGAGSRQFRVSSDGRRELLRHGEGIHTATDAGAHGMVTVGARRVYLWPRR
jgi:hypothetical protein